MKRERRVADTREKIMEAAQDLFYRQGYQATPVNQIIEQAGVSKPTFYHHFPSKEDLCVAYVQHRRVDDLASFHEAVNAQRTPYQRFLAPIRMLKPHMVATEYRGCRFFNMLAEIKDPGSPVVGEVRLFNDGFRALLREVTAGLLASHRKYAGFEVERVADAYYLIFCGAIMFSQEYRATWPLDLAESQVAALVAKG